MFDGLKDKLDRFRDDVEESAEEGEEETADSDVDAASEVGAAEAELEPESDAESGTQPESDAESEETGRNESESESDAEGEGESEDEAESQDEAETEDESGDEDRSIGERAKLFATGKTVIEEADLEEPLDDLELALLSSDVEMEVADAILDRVRENLVDTTRARGQSVGDVVEEALKDALIEVMSVGQFDFDDHVAAAEKPVVVVFTGVNGVGKTTSIAKLANRLESAGVSTVLANGDTYRAGANEQLQEHAANLDLDIITHEQGGDPAAVIYDAVEYAEANDVDVVLGDTAGRLHTSNDLMAQLEKIGRVVDPDLTVFVDEAVAGQDAVNRAREFDDAMDMDGAILTKADADADGGAAISIAHATGTPVLFLGTGQGYDDLEEFDPESMVEELFA